MVSTFGIDRRGDTVCVLDVVDAGVAVCGGGVLHQDTLDAHCTCGNGSAVVGGVSPVDHLPWRAVASLSV